MDSGGARRTKGATRTGRMASGDASSQVLLRIAQSDVNGSIGAMDLGDGTWPSPNQTLAADTEGALMNIELVSFVSNSQMVVIHGVKKTCGDSDPWCVSSFVAFTVLASVRCPLFYVHI